MSSLKEMLFSQYAADGLANLVEEMQTKYKPKKGRRFNHNNVTYEIGRPAIKDNALEFEISSKIPQDEIDSAKGMKSYFSEIKKFVCAEGDKPAAIEMENIVWGSKKDAEKERDYVKLLYRYSLSQLFDDKDLMKRCEAVRKGASKEAVPEVPGVFTLPGKMVLLMIRDSVQSLCRANINVLINANKKVKSGL